MAFFRVEVVGCGLRLGRVEVVERSPAWPVGQGNPELAEGWVVLGSCRSLWVYEFIKFIELSPA